MEIVRVNGILSGGERPSVMALGNFDGLHLGHQQLVRRAQELAQATGVATSVLTFYPHPRQVLGKGQALQLITPFDEKVRVLARCGVELCYVADFTKEFASLTAEEFVFHFLAALNPQTVVVGFDYAFGRGGHADASQLKSLAEQIGIYVEIVGAVKMYGDKVSSTLIREKLSYGDLRLVHELLGRPYALTGHVVHGEKRGRLLGFPTANIEMDAPYCLPKNGVYLVRVEAGGQWHAGVMNIGTKPTFHETGHKSLEAHLFQFDGDLYEQPVRVELLDFLRDEKKFFSVEELVRQIRQDVETAHVRLAQLSV